MLLCVTVPEGCCTGAKTIAGKTYISNGRRILDKDSATKKNLVCFSSLLLLWHRLLCIGKVVATVSPTLASGRLLDKICQLKATLAHIETLFHQQQQHAKPVAVSPPPVPTVLPPLLCLAKLISQQLPRISLSPWTLLKLSVTIYWTSFVSPELVSDK